MMGLPGRKQVW